MRLDPSCSGVLPLIAAWVFQLVLVFPPGNGLATPSDAELPQGMCSLLCHGLLNDSPESK